MAKKILTFILVISMAASMMSVAVFAGEVESEEVTVEGGSYANEEAFEIGELESLEETDVSGAAEEDAENADDVTYYDESSEDISQTDVTDEAANVEDDSVAEKNVSKEIDDAQKESEQTKDDAEGIEEEQTDFRVEETTTAEDIEKETINNSIKKADSSTTLNVTEDEINSLGALRAINNKLNIATENATDSNPYTVEVAEGSYTLTGALTIGSNTTLDLTGVTLTRDSSTINNMVRIKQTELGNERGYCYKNITIEGGTFDHNNGSNVCIKVGHVENFTLNGTTLKNAKNAHLLETGGVSGLTVKNCTFENQQIDKSALFYEAIQVDIPIGKDHPKAKHFGVYDDEALTSKDVVIENCTFNNVPRGVGNHTGILNDPFTGFTVKNCTFTNCKSAAIQTIDWNDINITGNTISNCPRGVCIFSTKDGEGTFLPSVFGSAEAASKNLSDSYSEATSTVENINIENNDISVTGTDAYATYEKRAIFVGGYNYTATSPKGSDASGGLPAGDYYVTDVTIKNNNIVANGHGIRLDDVKKATVSGNKISFKTETGDNTNYYGIQLRSSSQAESIDSNTITNPPTNGIFLNVNSSAKTIKNNTIKKPGKYGIGIEQATATTVSGNMITQPAQCGIFVFDGSSAGTITKNTILANSSTTYHSVGVVKNSKVTTITKNLIATNPNNYGITSSQSSTISKLVENAVATTKKKSYVEASEGKVSKDSKSYLVGSLFKDIQDANLYYCFPVYWAASKGITGGYSDGTFKPGDNCTRAHVVTFLWRLAGKPEPKTKTSPFKDVKAGQYYYKAVLWASEKGITGGYSDKTFRPDDTCLREHVITFLWRYAGKPKVNVSNPFNDINSSDYFYTAVLWANQKGIAGGYSSGANKGGFGPKLKCLREHVVTFLYRYAN